MNWWLLLSGFILFFLLITADDADLHITRWLQRMERGLQRRVLLLLTTLMGSCLWLIWVVIFERG